MAKKLTKEFKQEIIQHYKRMNCLFEVTKKEIDEYLKKLGYGKYKKKENVKKKKKENVKKTDRKIYTRKRFVNSKYPCYDVVKCEYCAQILRKKNLNVHLRKFHMEPRPLSKYEKNIENKNKLDELLQKKNPTADEKKEIKNLKRRIKYFSFCEYKK